MPRLIQAHKRASNAPLCSYVGNLKRSIGMPSLPAFILKGSAFGGSLPPESQLNGHSLSLLSLRGDQQCLCA
jgi:hypothetical protein